jgi:ferredoxin
MTPREAAQAAVAALPPPVPVGSVTYTSQGRLLVVGEGRFAERAAVALAPELNVSWLTSRSGYTLDAVTQLFGEGLRVEGYLGAFTASWLHQGVPQVQVFDLVLDAGERALVSMPQPPQGYFRVVNESSLTVALTELPGCVGSYEKPRFFHYRAQLCAHSRSTKVGCSRCIDVCSTAAIRSAGDTVEVDAHLCMGCGACASVCPSGAMSHQYPRPSDDGAALRAALRAWREAGGPPPVLLLHDAAAGEALGAGTLPPSILPHAQWHVASTGIDRLLGAVALGADRVAIMMPRDLPAAYRASLEGEVDVANVILRGLGIDGPRFLLIDGVDALTALMPLRTLPAATFSFSDDKRTTVELAIDHLRAACASQATEIALPAHAPYGCVAVDTKRCTLCMACAGACPASALMDTPDTPALRFLERNCVQCSLCEKTCPEDAIQLVPRLSLTAEARQPRVLNEDVPFHCLRCGKAFATSRLIGQMTARLALHAMFAGRADALKRLSMCADCRVIDLYSAGGEQSILKA